MMTKEDVANCINQKLIKNEYFIKYTFYELRIEKNLSGQEIEVFLELNKNYFENNGYMVYFTNETYFYDGKTRVVQPNELFIAIKDIAEGKKENERKVQKAKHR